MILKKSVDLIGCISNSTFFFSSQVSKKAIGSSLLHPCSVAGRKKSPFSSLHLRKIFGNCLETPPSNFLNAKPQFLLFSSLKKLGGGRLSQEKHLSSSRSRAFLNNKSSKRKSFLNESDYPFKGTNFENLSKKSFWNQTFDKSRLKNFVLWFLLKHGEYKTIKLVEELKTLGFQYATNAGISLGIEDLKIPKKKIY